MFIIYKAIIIYIIYEKQKEKKCKNKFILCKKT